MIKAERLPPMPAEFIARWLKPCMVYLSDLGSSCWSLLNQWKGNAQALRAKTAPQLVILGGERRQKEKKTKQTQWRHQTHLSPLPEERRKTEPWTSHMKRTKAQSPLTKSEQKRLDRISGRRSQRCLWISTRIGTSSDHRTKNKSTFVHSRITCSYFLLQSHAYVGLYCLKTWFIKTP